MAAPSIYTDEIAEKICELAAEGMSLRTICRQAGMPSRRTVQTWIADANHPFAAKYRAAREIGCDMMFDEIIAIADNLDGEVDRDRVRIDARKWALSKALPKKYGNKVDHQHGGNGQPITFSWKQTMDEFVAEIEDILGDDAGKPEGPMKCTFSSAEDEPAE